MRKMLLAVSVLSVILVGCDSSRQQKRSVRQGGDGGQEFELWLEADVSQGTENGEVKKYCFYVEVADTQELRRRGLSGRAQLADDKGMLFVMAGPSWMRMWMKDCLIPLDVLYFDRDKKLINFQTMAVPSAEKADNDLPEYPSDKPAQYALEVVAGTARRLGLKQGVTTISFSEGLLKRLGKGTE